MDYFLGISGGHSRSAAIAIRDGVVVGAVSGKPVNLHTFPPFTIILRLGELLNDLSERLGLASVRELLDKTKRLTLALPGAAKRSDQSYATEILRPTLGSGSDFLVVDDTWAGLIGGVMGSRGICAFAGTGASVFVGLDDFPMDKSRKMDGFGPILGDFGSGFQLVIDVFREMGRAFDQCRTFPLFQEICNHDLLRGQTAISEIPDLQGWFDGLYMSFAPEWRILFASLASAVTAAAERSPNPDLDAIRFVESAACDLAETIRIAMERFGSAVASLPIVFQGGMFEHSNLYRRTVIENLQRRYSNDARMGAFKTVFGAGLIACAREGLVPDVGLIRTVTSSVTTLPANEQSLLVNPGS